MPKFDQHRLGVVLIEVIEVRRNVERGQAVPDFDFALLVFQPLHELHRFGAGFGIILGVTGTEACYEARQQRDNEFYFQVMQKMASALL